MLEKGYHSNMFGFDSIAFGVSGTVHVDCNGVLSGFDNRMLNSLPLVSVMLF